MWKIDDSLAAKLKFKRYGKKYEQEFVSCFANLDILMNFLDAGEKIGGFKLDFFRSEGKGIYRIGQRKGEHETRLYVYPDQEHEIMYILSIGDKNTQQKDIKECKKIIRNI